MSAVVTSRSPVAARSITTARGRGSGASISFTICSWATFALKKYSGASMRTMTKPGTGVADACRERSPKVGSFSPGILPSAAMYGRLAR